MDKHCKGCVHHHVAGHPQGSRYERYNDWCTKFSNFAGKIIGHCKLNNGKKLREEKYEGQH